MIEVPYIDIHTHSAQNRVDVVTVENLSPGENIPEFTGRNFYSVGLHPWVLKSVKENNRQLNLVEDALELDQVFFVGECGLDKIHPAFDEQKRVFEAQAFMAEEFNKPLIIHCVKAYNEVMALHDKMHPQSSWMLHGYSGGVETTKQLENRGFLFSFGKTLLKNGSKVINSFKSLPLEKIFLETDDLDVGIEEIYRQGALLKSISVSELKNAVWQNFNRIENIL